MYYTVFWRPSPILYHQPVQAELKIENDIELYIAVCVVTQKKGLEAIVIVVQFGNSPTLMVLAVLYVKDNVIYFDKR